MLTDLEKALKVLDAGGVVGIPTETVYGLAARIDRPEGLHKIFSTKERPFFDPLIVHVASIEQARTCSSFWDDRVQILADLFWPGPLTLVIEKSEAISAIVTSGLTTVGLRSPDHPMALELIKRAGPLAAPSANRFGRTSPTSAEHVENEFQGQVPVLDGGSCEIGIESSIVAVEPGGILRWLRPGRLTREQISQALGERGLSYRWESVVKAQAPGQMQHHYMPEIPLVILAEETNPDEIRRIVEPRLSALPNEVEGVKMARPSKVERLQRPDLGEDPLIAARLLYQTLREAAAGTADLLYLVWPQSKRSGPWEAVWDRLSKASSLQIG